jgi:hypothetical protein
MSAYFQMGHGMQNLVGEAGLTNYYGIILSPINRTPSELTSDLESYRNNRSFDIVFDPQLYVPTTERGSLRRHPYFPQDLDTADPTRDSWWQQLSANIAAYAKRLGVDAVASPVSFPKVWNDEFYARTKFSASVLIDELSGYNVRVLQTVMLNYAEIGQVGAPERIASIVSGSGAAGYYVIVYSTESPRRELSDGTSLAGVMRVISLLEGTGKRVIVGFCSAEMILYKAAGASHCATGKFFNLRRLTPTRFEDEKKGGKQFEYWFETSLFAFLREPDLIRLRNRGFGSLLGNGASQTVWGSEILKKIEQQPAPAWIADGWRHYHAAFAQMEPRYAGAVKEVDNALRQAEEAWAKLNEADPSILFDEAPNDGRWIRPWRQALADFRTKQF